MFEKKAVKIILHVSWFVEIFLSLTLKTDKTNIRHHDKGVYFLGYKIWKQYSLNLKWRSNNLERKRQNESVRLNFSVPLEKLFLWYAERGFLQKAKKKSVDKFVGRK